MRRASRETEDSGQRTITVPWDVCNFPDPGDLALNPSLFACASVKRPPSRPRQIPASFPAITAITGFEHFGISIFLRPPFRQLIVSQSPSIQAPDPSRDENQTDAYRPLFPSYLR